MHLHPGCQCQAPSVCLALPRASALITPHYLLLPEPEVSLHLSPSHLGCTRDSQVSWSSSSFAMTQLWKVSIKPSPVHLAPRAFSSMIRLSAVAPTCGRMDMACMAACAGVTASGRPRGTRMSPSPGWLGRAQHQGASQLSVRELSIRELSIRRHHTPFTPLALLGGAGPPAALTAGRGWFPCPCIRPPAREGPRPLQAGALILVFPSK